MSMGENLGKGCPSCYVLEGLVGKSGEKEEVEERGRQDYEYGYEEGQKNRRK